jgi:minor extracellular serine protease Vpr
MELSAAIASGRSHQIELAQARVREAVVAQKAEVLHSTTVLLNAVYISATEQQAQALRSTPGVIAVVKVPVLKRHLSPELDLVNAQAGWNAVGGPLNAGAGSRIAVIDTGIDITHPAFNDAGFTAPAGYPICNVPADCAYTNRKVIVARSYVPRLATGNGTAPDSRPDDLTPRDRVGHGTAIAAIAAGVTNSGPAATITGVAPGAFLGNYKVFGSPGVNDVTFGDVVIQALEDAFKDGMNVAVLSLGHPGTWYYTDQVCGSNNTDVCDVWALAVENATNNGLTVVTSAGNEGDASGLGYFPNLNSIDSPGTAPAAITVGATTNSHSYYATASVQGNGVPGLLSTIDMLFSDGPRPAGPVTAPVRDVSALGDDGRACSPLPAKSLSGAFALITWGAANDCTTTTKGDNARNAGATGVIFYRFQAKDDRIVSITGLADTGIPSVLIGNTPGAALKQYLTNNHDPQVTLDPSLVEVTGFTADEIAYFSSEGPNISDFAIKPEIAAPGTGMYVATQSYDPNGDMWSPTGYTVVQGTSFSAAMVAGAVAIAHQRFPLASPAELKSMVVNTASPDNIYDFDLKNNRIPARVTGMGAGKLNLGNVAQTTITVAPATISFGVANPLPTGTLTLTLSNLGTTVAPLQLSIQPRDTSTASIQLSPNHIQLPPNTLQQVTVDLTGSAPNPGAYEGAIVITGGAIPIRVPYYYVVGDNTLDNVYQITNNWQVDPSLPASLYPELDFKAVDQYGVPVAVNYQWTPSVLIHLAGNPTDSYGIGYATLNQFTSTGPQSVTLSIDNKTIPFSGLVRPTPTIGAGRVNNAANGNIGQGLAPGSYIAIYGSGLSPATQLYSTSYLPISLAGVSVSFDSPDGKVSVPGHIHFVSDGQVNVQIPWELGDYISAQSPTQMKVSIGLIQSALYNVPLSQFSPGFFENPTDPSGPMAWALDFLPDNSYYYVASNKPAQRGDTLQFFVNGLGPVDHPTPSGEPAPLSPLSNTLTKPTVTIGGKLADVSFSGLTPTVVALYAVNITVPQDAPSGIQPLVISIGGVDSIPSKIAIQ